MSHYNLPQSFDIETTDQTIGQICETLQATGLFSKEIQSTGSENLLILGYLNINSSAIVTIYASIETETQTFWDISDANMESFMAKFTITLDILADRNGKEISILQNGYLRPFVSKPWAKIQKAFVKTGGIKTDKSIWKVPQK